ncbi:MAG: BTAD domain-containing putative transcriptional regulator [Actinomycetota bacterium]
MGLRIEVLGPMVATRDGQRVGLGGPKAEAVLATLVHHLGRVVPVGMLIEALWGDTPPPSARNVVQVKVSLLRRCLGPTFKLRTVNGGYQLMDTGLTVDLDEFERMVRSAEANLQSDPAGAARAAQRAIVRWRGDPADGRENRAIRHSVARLRERLVDARVVLLDARLRLGEHRACCADAAELADEHPIREDLRGLHMLALYRSSRQIEALAAYERARSMLVEEFGVEPGPELRALHLRMLRQDPALDLGGPPPDRGGALSAVVPTVVSAQRR